jgi:hypothetical protein
MSANQMTAIGQIYPSHTEPAVYPVKITAAFPTSSTAVHPPNTETVEIIDLPLPSVHNVMTSQPPHVIPPVDNTALEGVILNITDRAQTPSPSRFLTDFTDSSLELNLELSDSTSVLQPPLDPSVDTVTKLDYSTIWDSVDDSDSSSSPPAKIIVMEEAEVSPPRAPTPWEGALQSLTDEANIMNTLHPLDAIRTIQEVTAKFKLINKAKQELWSQAALDEAMNRWQ